jgi:hypothetical protein
MMEAEPPAVKPGSLMKAEAACANLDSAPHTDLRARFSNVDVDRGSEEARPIDHVDRILRAYRCHSPR